MSTLSQWFGQAGQSVGDDVLSRVTDELGLPTLPPLSIAPENTNPNNYVTAPAPAKQPPAPEVNKATSFIQKNWKILAAAGGVFGLVLLLRRK